MGKHQRRPFAKRLGLVAGLTACVGLTAVLGVIIIASFAQTKNIWGTSVPRIAILIAVLGALWLAGVVCLFVKKSAVKRWVTRTVAAMGGVMLACIVAFCALYAAAVCYPYQGGFATSTALYENKNVLVIVPHQDDDINLVGGMIEQYTQGGSDVTVVFSTNGDYMGKSEIRAVETVQALTALGVKKEQICYLGFGDTWQAQTVDGQEVPHIYHSPDGEAVWTSKFGASATYGTQAVDCYLDVPYTKNQYRHSLQTLLAEKRPDVIFCVDSDDHPDHKGTSFLFEEAMCNLLKTDPSYRPTVYKGYCYETAWTTHKDYFESPNLLSSRYPDSETWADFSLHYAWEERERFPVDKQNLHPILSGNTVYQALDAYASQEAVLQAEQILNGDKVFWKRRTDSVLYNAKITVGDTPTARLNDFKLKDFDNVTVRKSNNVGTVPLQGENVHVRTDTPVKADTLYLYDNPDEAQNILKGQLRFDDGSTVTFGPLAADGRATAICFEEKTFRHVEIAVTEWEGDAAGLAEIEVYGGAPAASADTCLMAVDADDHFVYDYVLSNGDTVALTLYNVPHMEKLGQNDVTVRLQQTGKNASHQWDEDALSITCGKGNRCEVTVSDGQASTTFTVSNPRAAARLYLNTLRRAERTGFHLQYLADVAKSWVERKLA